MSLMQRLRERAAASPQRVAFFEGDNPKIVQAAAELTRDALASCVLVGDPSAIATAAEEAGASLAGVELVDVTDKPGNERFGARFSGLPDAPLTAKSAVRRASRPLYRALMMQRLGEVDVTFGGIDCPTGDVIYAGQSIVGLADGVSTVSSVGIFDVPGWDGGEGGMLAFGDSAVCANPTAEQLASIAVSCCDTVRGLCGWEPRCALLSYSTCGSAEGELVDKVREALSIARGLRPDLKIDGEFQLDSAIVPAVAAKKVPRESAVAGRANVIVWPDINAGNIGVKLVQTFGRADAYGPMLQGFRGIVCDCSRSAPVSELVGNVVMGCVRAQALRGE